MAQMGPRSMHARMLVSHSLSHARARTFSCLYLLTPLPLRRRPINYLDAFGTALPPAPPALQGKQQVPGIVVLLRRPQHVHPSLISCSLFCGSARPMLGSFKRRAMSTRVRGMDKRAVAEIKPSPAPCSAPLCPARSLFNLCTPRSRSPVLARTINTWCNVFRLFGTLMRAGDIVGAEGDRKQCTHGDGVVFALFFSFARPRTFFCLYLLLTLSPPSPSSSFSHN